MPASLSDLDVLVRQLQGSIPLVGKGSPENVVVASPGRLYVNTNGGTNTTLYVKESGTASSGWIAK